MRFRKKGQNTNLFYEVKVCSKCVIVCTNYEKKLIRHCAEIKIFKETSNNDIKKTLTIILKSVNIYYLYNNKIVVF